MKIAKWVVLIVKNAKVLSRFASSRKVANKHFKETMAPNSSVSEKSLIVGFNN